jgi:predicted exporter
MSERLGSTIFALADPTRRGIVEALAHGRLSAGELADQLDVIPAVLTRHLRVLRDELLPDPLLEVRDWADDLAGYWQGQLASFTAHTQRRGIRGRG